jgi:hypothetical protein
VQESRGSPAAIGLAEEWLAVQQNKPEAMGLQAVADMALLVTKAHCDAAELALRGKNVVDSFASLQAAQSVASGHTVSQDLRGAPPFHQPLLMLNLRSPGFTYNDAWRVCKRYTDITIATSNAS